MTTVRFRTNIQTVRKRTIGKEAVTVMRNKIDRMYEAVRKINQVYEKWAALHGLTLYEMQIYYEIMKSGETEITQKDLCRKLDAPKTSVNSIIKKQLQAGYIEMKVNPLNRREKMISLTKSGLKIAKELIEPLLQYEEEAAGQICDDEMEIAIETQNRFADILLGKVEQKDE